MILYTCNYAEGGREGHFFPESSSHSVWCGRIVISFSSGLYTRRECACRVARTSDSRVRATEME